MASTGEDCPSYYSKEGCEKGESCPLRHSEPAKFCFVTCKYWMSDSCSYDYCRFRHAILPKKKNRTKILCYYEDKPSGCTKANCPFMHSNKRPMAQERHSGENDTEAGSVSAETMTIGDLMAISCSSDSIMLAWECESGTKDIKYKIAYKENKKRGSRWNYDITDYGKTIYTLTNLKENTSYKVKVCAMDQIGKTGCFSAPTEKFKTSRAIDEDLEESLEKLHASDSESNP